MANDIKPDEEVEDGQTYTQCTVSLEILLRLNATLSAVFSAQPTLLAAHRHLARRLAGSSESIIYKPHFKTDGDENDPAVTSIHSSMVRNFPFTLVGLVLTSKQRRISTASVRNVGAASRVFHCIVLGFHLVRIRSSVQES